jgi:hypothetical protein
MPDRDAEREVIVITGGLPPEARAAQDGDVRWTRREGETLEAFKARVLAAATEAGEPFVVIGGLLD